MTAALHDEIALLNVHVLVIRVLGFWRGYIGIEILAQGLPQIRFGRPVPCYRKHIAVRRDELAQQGAPGQLDFVNAIARTILRGFNRCAKLRNIGLHRDLRFTQGRGGNARAQRGKEQRAG